MDAMELQFAFPTGQWPLWLAVGAALVAAFAWLLRRLERRRNARLHRFVEAALAPRLLVGYDERLRKPLFWLPLIGFLFLLLAVAQPRWGRDWVDVTRASRDILVLLDTSESMAAENPLPNRLERARQKIESLLESNPGDRFGLVIFSGAASLECPLTDDHVYFRAVMSAISNDTLDEEGTDIAVALQEAATVFQADAERFASAGREARAVFLISDGEQVTGDAVAAARDLGAMAGIYVLGIGDGEGATIRYPAWMERYANVPDNKKTHVTKLDWDNLSQIALEGGGVAVRSTPDNTDVQHLQQELSLMRATSVSNERRFTLVNRYRWPLAVAMACFAAEALWLALLPVLRTRRMRREAARGEVEYA